MVRQEKKEEKKLQILWLYYYKTVTKNKVKEKILKLILITVVKF